MGRFGNVVYIDKDPNDPYKGWGWVEVTTEDSKKFGIPLEYPETYTKFCRSPIPRQDLPNNGNLPSRGTSGTKKFTLNIDGELVTIRAQKSLTIQAVCTATSLGLRHGWQSGQTASQRLRSGCTYDQSFSYR